MATYRVIQMAFWSDPDVLDNFTPEDKYFFLYLMTNPHTNLAGCYEISIRTIVMETGYSSDTVERLLVRMEKEHRKIVYDNNTKELLIVKWWKHNWTSSPKYQTPLLKEINGIKNDAFREYLTEINNKNDTVAIPYQYGSDTSITITNTNNILNTSSKSNKPTLDSGVYERIVGYLNEKAGTSFRATTKQTREFINGRIADKYTEEDFRKVIDTKCAEWLNNPEMRKFLRPKTLFSPTNFESYLNEQPKEKDALEEWLHDRHRV